MTSFTHILLLMTSFTKNKKQIKKATQQTWLSFFLALHQQPSN